MMNQYFLVLVLFSGINLLGPVGSFATENSSPAVRPAGVVTVDQPLSSTAIAAPWKLQTLKDTVAIASLNFSYTFATSDFAIGGDPSVTYTASLLSGGNLPAWLIFTEANRTFEGEPQEDETGVLTIEVTANNGITTETQQFDLAVRTVPSADINGLSIGEDHQVEFTEGDPPILVAQPLILADRDGTQLTFATITLRQRPNGREEYIQLTPAGRVLARNYSIIPEDYNPLSGAIELSGTATLEQYTEVIREIVYMNESVAVESGERDVAIQVKDTDGVRP